MGNEWVPMSNPTVSSAPSRLHDGSPAERDETLTSRSMIRFRCATCHEKLSVPESAAGRKGKCPNCGATNRVPSLIEAARPAEIPFPPRSKTRPEPAPPASSAAAQPPVAWPAAPPQPVMPQPVSLQPVSLQPVTPYQALVPAEQAPAPAEPAPVPMRNEGMELTERPTRWTRGPLKLEVEAEPRRWFGLRRPKPQKEDHVLGRRPEWQVDKRHTPMAVKMVLLAAGVLALIGVVWGFFYLVLKLVIAVSD